MIKIMINNMMNIKRIMRKVILLKNNSFSINMKKRFINQATAERINKLNMFV